MLLIDIGNTCVKLRRGGPPAGPSARLASAPTRPVDGLQERLAAAWPADVPREGLGDVWGVSVCDEAVPEIESFLGAAARWIGRDVPLPVALDVDHPDRVGPDRVLSTFAAWTRAGGPVLVVGCGTAITCDAAGPDGRFLGGVILPGVRLCIEALHEKTERLPRVEPQLPIECPARSTEAAISSGVLLALAGGVARVIAQTRARLGTLKAVFMTGGDAGLLRPLVDEECRMVADLALEGLERTVNLLQRQEKGRGADAV
jgi:type III pantothenate kinase